MKTKEIRDSIEKKILAKDLEEFDNDEEFLFAVGQLARFIVCVDHTTHNNYHEIIRFMKSDNCKKLQEKLKILFKKHGKHISTYNLKFNNMFSMALDYKPKNEKINENILIIGITSDSLLFTK